MLKKFFIASSIILAFSVGALAQTDWKGFYVGGNAGGTDGRSTADTSTIFSSTGYFASSSVPAINSSGRQKINPNGFTGGGQVGYDGQSGKWVYGAEADFDYLRLRGSATTTTTYPCCATSNFTVNQSIKTNWLFTARPRFGITTGHALIYATGGLAVTKLNYQATFTDTFANARENGGSNNTKSGWTAGGGVEYQLPSNKHWSLKGEYLYADFGRVTTTSTNLTSATSTTWPQNVFTHSVALHANIVRGGINYRW